MNNTYYFTIVIAYLLIRRFHSSKLYFMKLILILSILLGTTVLLAQERPNILWITSEDNGTFLGCYGDPVANTPNLDILAEEGIRYSNCYANAPVCAPMRNSWIQGMHAIRTGTHNMRSKYRIPESHITYPELFRKAGYYTTNNSKTDYNASNIGEEIWDECSNSAHYKNRKAGQPFFAVFNLTVSHEGQIFEKFYPSKYPQSNVRADKIKIPPYQYACTETFRDWQRMYSRIHDLDQQIGQLIKELKANGNAENTIIVYNSDHGGITLRSKRYLYDSGTRVPMIVYAPEKWKHLLPDSPGTTSDRLAQLIDLPATFLSIAGIEVPERMTGKILLGENRQAADSTILLFSNRFDEAPDMRRAVTNGKWKYIRNYEPDRIRYQMIDFPFGQAGQVAQLEAFKQDKTNALQSAHYLPQPHEELFNLENDPDEIHNLAQDTAYKEQLHFYRNALQQQLIKYKDAGFIPEPKLAAIDSDKSTTIFQFCQNADRYPLEQIIEVANLSAENNPANLSLFREHLQSENPIIRYWSVLGLRILGEEAKPAKRLIKKAMKDSDESVRIVASVAYAKLGNNKPAIKTLQELAKNAKTDAAANWAMDGLRTIGDKEAILELNEKEVVKGNYSKRMFAKIQKEFNK